MYSIYKQSHPTTGLEHSIYCNFFSIRECNLVVAGVNQLTVYRVNHDVEPSARSLDKESKGFRQKLECMGSFSLFGNIMSMKSVRLPGATRDSILLSFSEAKVALVEYDPGTHDLKTASMHFFEEDEMKDGFVYHSHQTPTLTVDPDNRCAVMLIYGTRLVVLPFRREGITEESDSIVGSKAPIMSSYIIDLRKLDEKIINVLDVQFLHGYYEPTLFILYEPLPTWAGRIAVRKDSCSIAAISLNIQEKVHPIIWSLSSLPHDCLQAYPVPKPIGGVLLFAANSMIYLNQSVPPYGVSLNGLTDHTTDFLLRSQEGVKITLDCAQADFIDTDKMVISLKGGELYVLTLMVDAMRHVKSFNFDKSAASVLTTCMCKLNDGFLFLGSRLGNSLLLKYTEKSRDTVAQDTKVEEPPTKKIKQETSELMASDVSQIDDLDELEVYGSLPDQPGSQITSYTFEVCDSLMNIGPCTQVVMGEPAFLSEEFTQLADYDLELVSTSGFGKNGALSVIQRSIRPQVVTTFELPGCTDMWTVYGQKASDREEEGEVEKEEKHSFLILSRDDSTMVLQTGQEIMELDHSGFSTQGSTIFAGNIGENKYIIQVSASSIRLLEGEEQLQHVPLDLGSPLVACSVADPYALVMSESGQVVLLTLKPDAFGSGVHLAVSKGVITEQPKVLTFCLYRDISGMFTETMEEKEDAAPESAPASRSSLETPFSIDKDGIDDEDELLYGDSDVTAITEQASGSQDASQAKDAAPENVRKEITPTFWAALVRESGVLEIYKLPDLELSFLVKNFPVGAKVLVDSGQGEPAKSGSTEKMPQAEGMPLIKELLIIGLGNKQTRPYLLARADEELLLYEAFSYKGTGSTDSHLKVRFKKISHDLILKERKIKAKKGAGAEELLPLNDSIKWLRPFFNVSGYAGVFVCGPYPHWIFMTYRGSLRIHPMGIDGAVTCFTPFVNVNCPKGFLYFNRQGELRISVLPTHLTYDAPWPVRKVPLRCTPHYVIYHPDSKTYAVITSVPEVLTRVCKVTGEGEKSFEDQTRDDRFIWPTFNRFSVQLFSPISWEAIPNTRVELLENEHVTGAKCVNLISEGTISGRQGYVVITTNMCYNEEVVSRGRILILDIIEVVPEPGQPLTKNKLKVVYDKEQKGPVTALDAVCNYLITAIGQKIYIWQLKDNDLSGVAFIDTQIYIHSIAVIKNLILVGDILKSVSLLRYQQDMKVLSLVSRDIRPCEVYATEFLVDDAQLNFLVSDREKNLLMYSYLPEVKESYGGQRLLRKADINVGVHINTFFRICCKKTDPSSGKQILMANTKRHVTFFASLDGSIGFVLPLSEKSYRRLLMLQNALNQHIQHIAGLNPRSYRLVHNPYKNLANPQKNILDGDLLWRYLHLSHTERVEIGKKLGTSPEQFVDDMLDIDRSTAHF